MCSDILLGNTFFILHLLLIFFLTLVTAHKTLHIFGFQLSMTCLMSTFVLANNFSSLWITQCYLIRGFKLQHRYLKSIYQIVKTWNKELKKYSHKIDSKNTPKIVQT